LVENNSVGAVIVENVKNSDEIIALRVTGYKKSLGDVGTGSL
jgi:hypothetical protein